MKLHTASVRQRPPTITDEADGGSRGVLDPLASDHPDDRVVSTTERRLQRLAIVAADVGARFAREAIPHDPVAWLLAPRDLFGGARALDACQEQDAFVRATLLHSLSLGLDADREDLDALLGDDEDAGGSAPADARRSAEATVRSRGSARLFTSTIEGRIGPCGRCIQAFCAAVAPDEESFRRRLRGRYGRALSETAIVQEGFDPNGVLSRTLLSEAVRRMLVAASRDPDADVGISLDMQLEQRFAA